MADKTTPAAAAEPRSAAKGAKPAKSPKPTKSSKAASAKPKPAGATVDWNRARGLVGQAMERDGLSLRGFASAVGIDHGNLSRFLAAGATGALATETAVALAEHLQLPLDGFLGLAPDGPTAARFLRVPLDEIAAGANPRRHFDEAKLAELADSIAEEGLRTPLWAVATEPGGEQGGQPTLYRLIAGERRLRALRILAADKTRKAAFQRVLPGALVPVQLYPADPLGEAVAAIVENVQREDLAQWELTAALVRLRDDHGLDGAAISRRLGLNERQVQQHLAINDKLSAELRVLYDAGDLSFTAARFAITDRRDVDLSPEAPAQAEADAEVAAPVLKSLFRGRIWHVEAVYRRYAPGAARGEFGVEFAIFQGDEEIDRAEARDDAVLAATALVLNQLTVGPLDAAIRGFLDLGDDPAEAEDLAGLCRTLGRLYIGQDPGVSGFFLKSVGALANWGAEPAAAPEAERRVLFEDAGASLVATLTPVGASVACALAAKAGGFEAQAQALGETADEAIEDAAKELAGDLADYDAEDTAAVFPLAERLLGLVDFTYHLDRWLSEHAPAGWVDGNGRIKPGEVICPAGSDAANAATFEVVQLDDGWRADAGYRAAGFGTTQPRLTRDLPPAPTREAAIAEAATRAAQQVREATWWSHRSRTTVLGILEPHLPEGAKHLTELPAPPAGEAAAEPGSAEAPDLGALMPTKGALLIAKRVKTHALRDATRKRQDVCKALVVLELVRQYGNSRKALWIRHDEQVVPGNIYTSPATSAVFAELAPALEGVAKLEALSDFDHGRLRFAGGAGDFAGGETSVALLRRLVALPAEQLNRLFCAAVAAQVTSAHHYDGEPGDDELVVALAGILAVDVRHAWSDPTAAEPQPYTLDREYLTGCSKAQLQAIAAELGVVKVTGSTRKADAVDMLLEHLPTDARAREWLPAPFHFATAAELPALGLGAPAAPRRQAAPRISAEDFERDVRPRFLQGDDDGEEGASDETASSLLEDLDEALAGSSSGRAG